MNILSFKILKKDPRTNARIGVLKTANGIIKTPSYVMVATHAKIKCLEPQDVKKTKTQVVIANMYHLWNSALKNKGNLVTKTLGIKLPSMTDSGGFQVFSFGAAREYNVGKVLVRARRKQGEKGMIRITDKGVYFNIDDQERFLSPEISMQIQEKIGADIIFAFDECTSPLHSFAHNKKAMERTYRWLKRCLKAKHGNQLLFGIVQGGRFNSLRKKSAQLTASLPVDGFGIGGSFGKNEMVEKLKAVIPYLPNEKPRHLLGIGKVEDIFNAVEQGIDFFDCVIPTREARHGRIYTNYGAIDIRKNIFVKDRRKLRGSSITFAQLHKLFKIKSPLAGRYATIHNVWFFNTLVAKIRESIELGKFLEFKRKYLKAALGQSY